VPPAWRLLSLMEAFLMRRLVTAIFLLPMAILFLAGCTASDSPPTAPAAGATTASTVEPTAEPIVATEVPTEEPTPVATRTLAPGETPDPTPISLAPFLTARGRDREDAALSRPRWHQGGNPGS
jgi:hypothetical protein